MDERVAHIFNFLKGQNSEKLESGYFISVLVKQKFLPRSEVSLVNQILS